MTDQRQISTGRGGAGNMASAPAAVATSPTAADLVTPTIKSEIYTTGRGGSGNMVANDDPAIARKAQDVEVAAEALEGHESGKMVFLGRGGAANVYDTSTGTDDDNDTSDNPTLDKGPNASVQKK